MPIEENEIVEVSTETDVEESIEQESIVETPVTRSAKEFLIDTTIPTSTSITRKSSTAPQYEYKVLMQNEIDFVIQRTTKNTKRILACIVSKNQFYVKNEKTGDVKRIESGDISRFIIANDRERVKNMLTEVKWDALNYCNWEKKWPMMRVIESERYRKALTYGLHSDYTNRTKSQMVEKDVKIYRMALAYQEEGGRNWETVFANALMIKEAYGIDRVRTFLKLLTEAPVEHALTEYNYRDNFSTVLTLIKDYRLEYSRVMDFLFTDLYSQGISQLDDGIVRLYKDYLRMQNQMYDRVKIKYPKALKTDHDVLAMKHTLYHKYKGDDIAFDYPANIHDLAYKSKDYMIIPANRATDLIEEGVNLSHCVGTYVKRVEKQESFIFFMRKIDEPEESLVTIEIKIDREQDFNSNNKFDSKKDIIYSPHIAGHSNRSLTIEESAFIHKWASRRKVRIETSYVVEESKCKLEYEQQSFLKIDTEPQGELAVEVNLTEDGIQARAYREPTADQIIAEAAQTVADNIPEPVVEE